jgi:hypothetical protein
MAIRHAETGSEIPVSFRHAGRACQRHFERFRCGMSFPFPIVA